MGKVGFGELTSNAYTCFTWYHHHHHHHSMPIVQVLVIVSLQSSQVFISLVMSSHWHSVSSHTCWMGFQWTISASIFFGAHNRMSLISSCLLLQECPTNLVRLLQVRWEKDGHRATFFVECCFQDIFSIHITFFYIHAI